MSRKKRLLPSAGLCSINKFFFKKFANCRTFSEITNLVPRSLFDEAGFVNKRSGYEITTSQDKTFGILSDLTCSWTVRGHAPS